MKSIVAIFAIAAVVSAQNSTNSTTNTTGITVWTSTAAMTNFAMTQSGVVIDIPTTTRQAGVLARGPVCTRTTGLPNDPNGNGFLINRVAGVPTACAITMLPRAGFSNFFAEFNVWFHTLACANGGRLPVAANGGPGCNFFPVGGAINVFIRLTCPVCDQSKKGLLGLLGLLGLIPLLLCSLICCCLLCVRRKKTEGDVHFATFDAGAPAVAEFPIHTATVHSHTHVGAPIVGAPIGGTFGGFPAVY